MAAEADVCPPVAAAPTEQQMKEAVAAAQDHGMLWRISKDGHSSYLYGTLHIGKLAWAFPGPRVMAALHEVDAMALELDPSDPSIRQVLTEGSQSNLALPPALAQRLARQFKLACVDVGLFAKVHPVMQVVTLSVLAARTEGLDAGWGQEMVLAEVAHALKRPITSLETPQSQLKALIPDDPQEARMVVDDALSQLENKSAPATMRRLADSWAQGKLDDLASYERWCECADSPTERVFMRRLLDDRNPYLADGIDALHRQGQRVFAAVGALHMAGDSGLPQLLGKRGYTVERISFADKKPS
jgi:uncharacterized protein YbaP (TraB family)